jgi:hypothetical protein
VTLVPLSRRPMLKQLIQGVLVHIPNDKTLRMGHTRNRPQIFGKATHAGCQRTLWQATVAKGTSSPAPRRPDESWSELVQPASVPQAYLDKILRTALRYTRGGVLCSKSCRHRGRGPTRRQDQIMPPRGGRGKSGRHEAALPEGVRRGRTRSGHHEAALPEVERGSVARSGGALAPGREVAIQGEAGCLWMGNRVSRRESCRLSQTKRSEPYSQRGSERSVVQNVVGVRNLSMIAPFSQ